MVLDFQIYSCRVSKAWSQDIQKQFNANGVTRINKNVYQMMDGPNLILKWKAKGKGKFEVIETKSMPEARNKSQMVEAGWGATKVLSPGNSKDSQLWVSDGTDTLKQIDPSSWKIKSFLKVVQPNGQGLQGINALEAIMSSAHTKNLGIKHYVFATVLNSNNIYMIDLRTGHVAKHWDLSELHQHQLKHVQLKL